MHPVRSGYVKLAVACGILLTVAAITAVWLGIRQAQRDAEFARLAGQARPLLQQSLNEDALDVLTSIDSSSAPPENRYLKAIALDRLQRYEAANAEIRLAIEQSPENPRYKAFELKLRLFARDRDSIDQLIELNRDFASIGAVALLATYGFQAKAVLLGAENKPEAAQYHSQRKEQTLDTALTLSAEIPELYPELLQFAIREDRHEESLRLIDELLEIDPSHLELRDQKVKILIAMKRIDDAVVLAQVLYDETGGTRQAAEYFAAILAQASDKPEHEEKLQRLLGLYPSSTQIVSKYAVYLTRTGRLHVAQTRLAEAIENQNDNTEKQAIAFAAITLPLEVNAPDIAEETLREYRGLLKDELLINYFEARILFLRKRHSDAVRQMLKIVEASKNDSGRSSRLASEALSWVRTILADKVLAEQMELVVRASQKSADAPKIEVRVAAEESEENKPAAPSDQQPESATAEKSVSASEKDVPATDSPAGAVPSP
jgi:tetratricopeptide (TPR) repeat protein